MENELGSTCKILHAASTTKDRLPAFAGQLRQSCRSRAATAGCATWISLAILSTSAKAAFDPFFCVPLIPSIPGMRACMTRALVLSSSPCLGSRRDMMQSAALPFESLPAWMTCVRRSITAFRLSGCSCSDIEAIKDCKSWKTELRVAASVSFSRRCSSPESNGKARKRKGKQESPCHHSLT